MGFNLTFKGLKSGWVTKPRAARNPESIYTMERKALRISL